MFNIFGLPFGTKHASQNYSTFKVTPAMPPLTYVIANCTYYALNSVVSTLKLRVMSRITHHISFF